MYISLNKKKKFLSLKNIIKLKQLGFSTTEMIVVLTVVGISTIIVPNFGPALEFVEVLIAEKYLLGAVKECQVGIVNNDSDPQYTFPNNDVGLGIFKNNKFVFSHTESEVTVILILAEIAYELQGSIPTMVLKIFSNN